MRKPSDRLPASDMDFLDADILEKPTASLNDDRMVVDHQNKFH